MLLSGCEACSILGKCHKRRVQILQNKCLMIIFNALHYASISELHNEAEIPSIEELLESRKKDVKSHHNARQSSSSKDWTFYPKSCKIPKHISWSSTRRCWENLRHQVLRGTTTDGCSKACIWLTGTSILVPSCPSATFSCPLYHFTPLNP